MSWDHLILDCTTGELSPSVPGLLCALDCAFQYGISLPEDAGASILPEPPPEGDGENGDQEDDAQVGLDIQRHCTFSLRYSFPAEVSMR